MNANSENPAPPRRAPRWKRLLQNLALFCVVFLLCVAAFEIALRIAGYGNLEIYTPDEKLFWRLKPNQQCFTKIDHKPVRINSQGTRGQEIVQPKPANTIRILSLGDSRTFGWGLTEDETYTVRLGKLLQEKLGPSRRVEVINAGVNAWSYPQMYVYFRERGLAYQPDIVILADANLWTQFSEKSSPEFVKSFLRRVWLKNFLRRFAIYHFVVEVQLKSFYEQHRSKFIPVDPQKDTLFKEAQQSDPDELFRDAIENLCRLAQTNGVKPLLLNLPIFDDLASTNLTAPLRAKRVVSERLGVSIVDVAEEIRPGGKELYLDADPVHFDAKGNEIIARKLLEPVAQLVTPTTP